MDFKGKTVVVTGGSRGIGRELCLQFAQRGANIAFCYQNTHDKAMNLKNQIEQMGVGCLAYQCSVSKFDQISDMMKDIVKQFGQIDILINNAGLLKVGAFAGMRQSDWAELIETNLNGVFICSKLALPHLMKTKNGAIVNMSSFMAFLPAGPAQAVYAATKAGVIGFTRSLSKEVASAGIRVNAIAPGLTDTDMITPLGENLVKEILQHTNSHRLGTVTDITNLAVFLSSDLARNITGQTFVSDGGGVHYQF